MTSRIDCRNISEPGSQFTTATNEGESRSNITAVMICSAFWPRSACPRARPNMGRPARCAGLLLAFGLLAACDRTPTQPRPDAQAKIWEEFSGQKALAHVQA